MLAQMIRNLQWSSLLCTATLLLAQYASAQSPQLPQYTQQGYSSSSEEQGRTTTPPSEVRVDPFVTPASSLSPVNAPSPNLQSPSQYTAGSQSTGRDTSTEANNSLALKPRRSAGDETSEETQKQRTSSFSSVLTMFSSLLVVIALFFGLMFMLKKANGGNMHELPRDVFQVMGTSRIAGRHSLFLLRLGHKLVLVHAGSGEVQTITEVTDPVEVDRLCGSCEENQSNSLTQSFKQVLKNVTEGTSGKSKSFADNLRFRNKVKEDADEVSPAVALLAKEKI